jgi:hypothetical protein
MPAARVGFSSHSVVPAARVGFLHFALDSDPRAPLLLVAARPIFGRAPAAWGSWRRFT